MKPLQYIEESIIQLSNLKLQKSNKLEPWIGTKSEIGKIATATSCLSEFSESSKSAKDITKHPKVHFFKCGNLFL